MSVSRLVVSVIVLVGNLTLVSTPAAAAVLLVNGSGMTGATDVNVGGTLYDVEFVDGGRALRCSPAAIASRTSPSPPNRAHAMQARPC